MPTNVPNKHQPSMDHFWDFGIPALNPCDLSVKRLMWTDQMGGENGGGVGF